MASSGSGYDLSASTFSPDGRIFQIEYANKAVEGAGTVLGIKCSDGVVLAAAAACCVEAAATEKMRHSRVIQSEGRLSLSAKRQDPRCWISALQPPTCHVLAADIAPPATPPANASPLQSAPFRAGMVVGMPQGRAGIRLDCTLLYPL